MFKPKAADEPLPKDGYEPPLREHCGACKWFSPIAECRWDPPLPIMANNDPTMKSVWPKVKADDWCGRFTAAPVVQTQPTRK